jgi:hypothetical protein
MEAETRPGRTQPGARRWRSGWRPRWPQCSPARCRGAPHLGRTGRCGRVPRWARPTPERGQDHRGYLPRNAGGVADGGASRPRPWEPGLPRRGAPYSLRLTRAREILDVLEVRPPVAPCLRRQDPTALLGRPESRGIRELQPTPSRTHYACFVDHVRVLIIPLRDSVRDAAGAQPRPVSRELAVGRTVGDRRVWAQVAAGRTRSHRASSGTAPARCRSAGFRPSLPGSLWSGAATGARRSSWRTRRPPRSPARGPPRGGRSRPRLGALGSSGRPGRLE